MGLQSCRFFGPNRRRDRSGLRRRMDACRGAPSRRHRADGGGPLCHRKPIARYWYADMLAERGGAEDVEAAKAMLKESIAASDRIGLGLYARLARQKLGES